MMQRLPLFLQLAAVACLVGAVVVPLGEALGGSASAPLLFAQTESADSPAPATSPSASAAPADHSDAHGPLDYWSLIFVFVLATFIGLGVVGRVSRLLHTPLMSLTNAISAIAVVGAIIVTGTQGYPPFIRFLGAVALFASMTNIVSGFLITERMLKMFKQSRDGGQP
jgi:NAD(P) transhydrogenase subunit alpha